MTSSSRFRPWSATLLLAAGLVLVVCVSPALAKQQSPSDFSDYRGRVQQARKVVRDAAASVGEVRVAHDVAARVNTLLPSREEVRLGTDVIEVDNSVLRSLVARLDSEVRPQSRKDTLALMDQHLASLERAVAAGAQDVPQDPAELRKLLDSSDVSAQRQFAELLARITDRLQELLKRLLGRTAGPPGPVMQAILWIVIGGLAALLAVAVFLVLRTVRAGTQSKDASLVAAPLPAVVAAAEGLPPDAKGYAEQLAGEGRYREAVRALFGGAARSLADAGLVKQTRTRTNTELIREAHITLPAVTPPLSSLSEAFERAWYGHSDPGSSGWESARGHYRSAIKEIERPRAEGGEEK